MAGSKYSESLTPTRYSLLFQIKAHVSKGSKLHTKLRQLERMDFFAGKEADMLLEKERSRHFLCLEVRIVEGEKTERPLIACSCRTPSL